MIAILSALVCAASFIADPIYTIEISVLSAEYIDTSAGFYSYMKEPGFTEITFGNPMPSQILKLCGNYSSLQFHDVKLRLQGDGTADSCIHVWGVDLLSGDVKHSVPIMVLAYMIETPRTGEGNDQCIQVTKAGFTNEPVVTTHDAIINGTFNPEPKLELISESGIPYEVKSSELNEMLKNNPGGTISFELIANRRANLDYGSRAVLNDVLNSLPGFELRDAQDHSNWIPFDWIADEPAPGYSASDCHGPIVPKIGAINEASPTPSADSTNNGTTPPP